MALRSMALRAMVLIAMMAVASCASEPTSVTRADYLDGLQRICDDTTATIDQLPQPPEQISVVDFATSASDALVDEADRARALDVPDDLAADHRAFVLNTDEQAAAWRAIAAAPDEIDAPTTRLGELVRGRNDLADEIGAVRCRRGDV